MAGGQQINSGQGALVFEGPPGSDAVTGSESTSAVGDTGNARLIRLRSRKVGAGSAARVLAGVSSSVATGSISRTVGPALLGSPVATVQGAVAKQRSALLTGVMTQAVQTPIGPQATSDWIIGDLSYTQGAAETKQLSLPSTSPSGGVYQIASGTLPSGVGPVSETGSVPYDGAGAPASSSVTFAYIEPGALPTLTLHVGTGGTNVPYMATAYPTESAVPSGYILTSPDDANLQSSVLSTWPDNSAQVVVLAGKVTATAGAQVPIRLRPGLVQGSSLTVAAIQLALPNGISVNFGTQQNLTQAQLASPDWIWWQNSQVICARYRLSCGLGAMEAVIDIHAFAGGRAFVEVVIENGKIDATASLTTNSISPQTYTNATVSVNGTQIAQVSSPTAGMTAPRYRSRNGSTVTWAGGHGCGRAWYCAAEINSGTVTPKTADTHHLLFGLEVTHDVASLQAHPWGFLPAVPSSETMATKYEKTYDRYEPWSTGRLRVPAMPAGGGDEQILSYTGEQADYIVTGDKVVRRSLIAHGLSCLSMQFNWRHTDGRPPTLAQIDGKCFRQNGSNPNTWPFDATSPSYGDDDPRQIPKLSHIPQIAFYPFLCRPSPCFIEVAQKEFCWQVLGLGVYKIDSAHWQDRGHWNGQRALWNSLRNYGIAAFLTPSMGPGADVQRKSAIASAVNARVVEIQAFYAKPWNTLKTIYGGASPYPDQTGLVNHGQWYQKQYGAQVLPMVAGIKVLTGTQQDAIESVTRAHLGNQVGFINDAIGGEWRAILYYQYEGEETSPGVMDMGPGSYQERNRLPRIYGTEHVPIASGGQRLTFGPDVPAERGKWFAVQGSDTSVDPASPNWVHAETNRPYNSFDYEVDDYVSLYMIGLVRAVEFGVPGAEAAWSRVFGNSTRGNWDANAGITNLSAAMPPLGASPRQNTWPRNKA